MERFVAGDVVVVSFPHSNLKAFKRRPALILSQGDYGDVVLCQITSFKDASLNTVTIRKNSFIDGGLPVMSYVRPDKLFTADQSLILKRAGKLNDKSMAQIKLRLAKIFDL